jgi:hypothetical protein
VTGKGDVSGVSLRILDAGFHGLATEGEGEGLEYLDHPISNFQGKDTDALVPTVELSNSRLDSTVVLETVFGRATGLFSPFSKSDIESR